MPLQGTRPLGRRQHGTHRPPGLTLLPPPLLRRSGSGSPPPHLCPERVRVPETPAEGDTIVTGETEARGLEDLGGRSPDSRLESVRLLRALTGKRRGPGRCETTDSHVFSKP